jgi:hypothetical protein
MNFRKTVNASLSALVLVLLFTTCNKSDDDQIYLSHNLKLLPAEFIDNQIVLEWNKPYVPGLTSYLVYRYETEPGPPNQGHFCYYDINEQLICYYDYYLGASYDRINDPDQTSFTDHNVSISDKLYYRVVAIGDTTLISNTITVDILDVQKLNFSPTDMVYLEESHALVFLHRDPQNSSVYKINQYSLADSVITDSLTLVSESWGSYTGLATGTYNGSTDIYCWLAENIYRIKPEDLSVAVSGNLGESVQDITDDGNGHVFVSTTYSSVYSLNRENFETISSLYAYGSGHLFYNQGRLLSADAGSYPDVQYMRVSSTGVLTSSSTDWYSIDGLSGDFNASDGTLISTTGTLFNFDFETTGNLSLGSYNTSQNRFYFDHENSKVYRTDYANKSVEVYSLANYNRLTTYSTLGWPLRIFQDKHGSIVVVSATNLDYYNSVIIEYL